MVLAIGLFLFLAPRLAVPSHDPSSGHFQVGERLTYALSWGIISAGTAVLEVAERQTVGGRPVVKLVNNARSNEFISDFYPLTYRVDSMMDVDADNPHRNLFKR